jgi:hypothetical protein
MPQIIAVAIGLVLLYFLVVYVVIPAIGIILLIGLAVLGLVALAGLLAGLKEGLRNFVLVLVEAHKRLP